MNNFKSNLLGLCCVLEFIAFFAVLFMSLFLTACSPVLADNPTDYFDNEVSEQISQQAKQRMRDEWKKEHGDIPPNMTPSMEQELVRYTQLKQFEINQRQGK